MLLAQRVLQDALKTQVEVFSSSPVGGGCISHACRVESSEGVFFMKTNQPSMEDLFKSEEKGLTLLSSTKEIAIPKVIGTGVIDDAAYIVLEHINGGLKSITFFEDFGQKLARLHQHSSKEYGLHFDNYIGSLPQSNVKKSDWLTFFIEKRLQFQLKLDSYIPSEIILLFERLYTRLPDLLPDYGPSLLHGDLWSGNYLVGETGDVVLIDPAVYYGNREIELAFTRMFGGFDTAFYHAYEEVFPLEPGFEDRIDIYNLYPLLVHHNLFGGGYLNTAVATLKKYVG